MAEVNTEGAGEFISLGAWMGLLIEKLDVISSIIKREQAECVINTLKKWRKERKISESPYDITPQNETIRPAITFAYGIIDNQVKVSDLVGHGSLVITKDGHLLYIGRLNPNWARVIIGKRSYTIRKNLGKRFAQKIEEELYRARTKLNENLSKSQPIMSLDTLEFGILDFGLVSKLKEVFVDEDNIKSIINPLHMQQCRSNDWLGDITSWLENFANDFLAQGKMVGIPLYLIHLLDYYYNLSPSDWKLNDNYYHHTNSKQRIEDLHVISARLPHYYFTITFGKWVDKNFYVYSYSDFIGNYIRSDSIVFSSYSVNEILRIGIGSPLQSSDHCNANCTQLGSFGQNIGIGRINTKGNAPHVYIGVPYPNYADMTTEEIKNYYQELLEIGNLIDYSLKSTSIIMSIMDELEKKYNASISYFTFLQTPITDDEREAKNIATKVAEIGYKIYQKARERLIIKGKYEALDFVGQCIVEIADDFKDIDEQVDDVVQCSLKKAGIFEEDEEEEFE